MGYANAKRGGGISFWLLLCDRTSTSVVNSMAFTFAFAPVVTGTNSFATLASNLHQSMFICFPFFIAFAWRTLHIGNLVGQHYKPAMSVTVTSQYPS